MTTLAKLKKAYKKAFNENLAVFTLDGRELCTLYAKYLIEYFQNQNVPDGMEIEFT